jgi:hypothetical protein
MSETGKIIITSIATLIGGVILLVAGHLITKLFVEPLLKLRGVIGEISFSLIYYTNIIGSIDDDMLLDKEKTSKAKDSFRKLAAELPVAAYALPCYRIFNLLRLVPSRKNVLEAAPNLIGLSNTSRTTSL